MGAVQEVLRQMVAELAEVRGLIAAVAVQPCTAALAQDAKNVTTKQALESYSILLGKIEKLGQSSI